MAGEWDSDEWRKQRDERLLSWLAGDADAVRAALCLTTVAETWDDLIDGDVSVTQERIHTAFIAALVGLNTNPFFVRNHASLMPLMIATINAYLDANEFERDEDAKIRMLGFHIRNMGIDITIHCAFLVGGFEHMRRVSAEIRRFFAHESYDEWEHRHEGGGK